MEDGELLGRIQKKSPKFQNVGGMGELFLPSASVDIFDVRGRKMRAGKLLEKDRKCRKWQKLGRNWGDLIPSFSASFREGPRCAWAEDGRWGIIRKEKEKSPKLQKLGRGGGIIASVSCRQHPWTSAMCADGRWELCDY